MLSPELDKNSGNRNKNPPDPGGTETAPPVIENLVDSDVDIPDDSTTRKRKNSGEGESSASRICLEKKQERSGDMQIQGQGQGIQSVPLPSLRRPL